MAKKVVVNDLLTDIEATVQTQTKVSNNNVSSKVSNISSNNNKSNSKSNVSISGRMVRESVGVRALGVSGLTLKTTKEVADYMANLMLDKTKRPFEKKMEMDMCKVLYEVLSKEQEKNINNDEITRESIKIEVVSASKDEELQKRLKRIEHEIDGNDDYQA